MTDQHDTERRGAERYAFELDTEVRLDFDTVIELGLDREILPGHAHDISEDGMSLVIGVPIKKGSEVEVRLRVMENNRAETPPVTFSIVTAWCSRITDEKYQLGGPFEELSARQREQLSELVGYLKQGNTPRPPQTFLERLANPHAAFDLSDQ